MRKRIPIALALMLLSLPLFAGAQQKQSVAEASKKTRVQKKNSTQAPGKVFTNDNIDDVKGTINVVGSAPEPAPSTETTPAAKDDKADKDKDKDKDKKDEPYWRGRSAAARGRLKSAEHELDILQRELNLKQQQYYSDPNKALRQQNDRSDINNQMKAISDKTQEVAKYKQALADLEDELRRAGGDASWGREK